VPFEKTPSLENLIMLKFLIASIISQKIFVIIASKFYFIFRKFEIHEENFFSVFNSSVFAASASAEALKFGFLSRANFNPEGYHKFARQHIKGGHVRIYSLKDVDIDDHITQFYDSLSTMQIALDAGKIDIMCLPEPVAQYVMNVTKDYQIQAIMRGEKLTLAFGFRKSDTPELKNKFNEALTSMKADGTPAGFNTAVLAEIAKRLKINIELVNINAGVRAASLASGRSDVVFWFATFTGEKNQPDVPENIVLSEPYYEWIEYLKKFSPVKGGFFLLLFAEEFLNNVFYFSERQSL